MKTTNKDHGFTIVELMVATVVFSLVLVLCLTALIQVSRIYFKGVTTARTQEAARQLIDDITQAVQFSAASVTITGPVAAPVNPLTPASNNYGRLCVGDKRYSFVVDRKLTGVTNETNKTTVHAVWVDDFPNCANRNPSPLNLGQANPDGTNGRELLGENMRLANFNVGSVDGPARLWNVRIAVVYGDNDLIEYAEGTIKCLPGTAGTQYCATSQLNSMIQRRVQ